MPVVKAFTIQLDPAAFESMQREVEASPEDQKIFEWMEERVEEQRKNVAASEKGQYPFVDFMREVENGERPDLEVKQYDDQGNLMRSYVLRGVTKFSVLPGG